MIQAFGLMAGLATATLAAQSNPAGPAANDSRTVAPPAAASAPAAAPRNIRFQFEGIPYRDVIERFAQMSGKPLLAETNVLGTLSYNDPNPYTFPEALDTLNLILSMKGFMLVESGHYLRLVPLKELPSMPLRILRSADPTGDVRPGEVVTVVLDVENVDSKEVADAVTAMLSKAGSLAVLPRGRGLIVTDRIENIQRMRLLLSAVDTKSTVNRQMKTYTLLNASGAIVADLLNRTFGVATAPKRTTYNANTKAMEVLPPDPNDYITAVYDDASRTLVMFGPTERLELAEELINRFEQKDGPAGDVRIYYPQTLRADELAAMLRQAIPGVAAANEIATTAATKARLITDTNQNRLIVAAPILGQLEQIEQLINRVDKPVHGQPPGAQAPVRSEAVQLTRVFRPRASEATNVSHILTQALTRRGPTGQPVTSASVTFDAGSQSVIVSGSPRDLQISMDIMSQLETGTTHPMPMQTRFIEVGSPAEARKILPLVEQLYRNQAADGGLGAGAHAKMVADPNAGRLIVTASEEHANRIEALVRQLRPERPLSLARRLEIVPLQHARIESAFASLQNIVQDKMADPTFADIPKPSLLSDVVNNRLLVTATEAQIAEIKSIVALLDVASEKPARQFKALELFGRTASELAPLATQLYQEQIRGISLPSGAAATVMVEGRSNRLMVSGEEKEIARLEAIVRQLDPAEAKPAKEETRVVRLKTAQSAEISGLVEKSINARNQKVRVLVDARSNSLVLNGDPAEVTSAAQLIQELDVRPETALKEMRILDLRSGDASAIAPTITSLFQDMIRDQRGAGAVSETKIIPDPAGQRLIVTGPREEIAMVARLVNQVDQTPEQSSSARVFKLQASQALAMAPIVSNAMVRFDARGSPVRKVVVAPDERSNSLIITGARSDLQDAALIIERLEGEGDFDTGGSRERSRDLRIVPVNTSDADGLATLAMRVFAAQNAGRSVTNWLSITPEPAGKRMIVLAPPSMMAQVETVILALDQPADQAARELHSVELKQGNASAVFPTVSKIYEDQSKGKTVRPATLYPDATGTRLTVWGTKDQAETIRQIVATLEGESRAARETKIVELGRQAEAERLLPLARQLYKDQLMSRPGAGAPDAQFITDGRTGRVVISARQDQMPMIDGIFAALRKDHGEPAVERETKSFEVGNAAEVQRLLPLVQQLYKDQWKEKQDTDPADAQLVGDALAGRIVASGKPAHLKQIEQILQQLGGTKPRAEAGGRETRVFDLTTANASELASTLRTLYLEEAKSRLGNIPPDTLILPDAAVNRIIATGSQMELAAVDELVKKLDRAGAQSASARVFRLKHAEPEKVMEILSTALVRYDAYGRPQRRVSISVDPGSRTLIATGDPKELQAAAVILEQLDSSLGGQFDRKMKVLPVKSGKVSDWAPRLRQLYADQMRNKPGLGTADALILEDELSNQLILTAATGQLELLEQILGELQQSAVNRPARETKMVEVGPSEEVDRLLPLVRQLYQERFRDRSPAEAPDAQILPDARNGRFIVTARTNHIAEIESILTQLKAKDTPAPRETKVFDLTSASAVDLAVTVKTLYAEQSRDKPGVRSADAMILPDAAANRLIVTASAPELEILEGIVRKLDKASSQSATARVFSLKHADPQQVASVLSESLVRIVENGRRVPRVSVGADSRQSMLVVSGESKDLQAAALIVEQMDTAGSQEPRRMRILPLKSGVASQVAARVRQLYQDQSRGLAKDGGADALILPDDASSRLVVTGSETRLRLIEEIVAQLQDGGAGAGREARIIKLEHHSAPSLVAIISRLFSRQVASQDPAERVMISAGPDDRTIVLDAAGRNLDQIQALVAKLDQSDADSSHVIQAVQLKKGDATTLAEAVNQAMAARYPGRRSLSLGVTPVSGANSLLLNGPTNQVSEVLRIVKELDQESAGDEIQVRIFKLENGNVREVQGVLRQLLRNVSDSLERRRSDGRNVEATVAIDERGSQLIVTATDAHFKVVEQVLPTLDKAPERSDRDVHFVWLKKAKAFDVVSKIQTLYENRPSEERPILESDSNNNSITVIARKADLAQIQDLISRLDDTSRDASVQVRLRSMDRVAAEQMARMLRNIYPQVSSGRLRIADRIPGPGAATNAVPPATSGTAPSAPSSTTQAVPGEIPEVVVSIDKDANALILSGPVQELDHIDTIISELTFSFYGNESEFRMFPLRDADPVIVARALSDLLRQDPPPPPQPGQTQIVRSSQPRITVVAEPRTRSVIVRARPTDFQLLESLIRQLDTAGQTAQLQYRVVPLTNAPPQKVLAAVQQMVTQLNASRPGEPLSVSIDGRSNGILVIGRDTLIQQVENMIRSLDTPSSFAEAEMTVVPLKHANAAQLVTVLQSMLRPGPTGETTAQGRELQEQIRRLRIRDPRGEPVVLDLSQPIRLSADGGAGQGGGNRIVVTSTPSNLQALTQLIAMMDREAVAEGVMVRFVPLQHADAATVAQTLNLIFQQGQRLRTGPAGPGAQPEGDTGKALTSPLNVALDTRSNTLILSGHEESIRLALRVVDDVDKPMERFVTEVRLFRLKHATATRVAPLLQAVFAEGSPVPGSEGLSTQVSRLRVVRDRSPRTTETAKARAALTIQADDLSNTLVVAARSDTLPLITEVIEQLDIPAASGLETVRIYPLNHADPLVMQRVLNDLYTNPRAGQMRTEDKPIISVDDRTSSLIVAGNPKSFAIIESMLQRLDQPLPFSLRDIRILPLEHADASELASTLQRLVDARITQRAAANQTAADALKVTILADPRSNSLLVGGSRDSYELVETLARQLDKPSAALSGQMRVIPLQHADARVLSSTLASLFQQRYAAARSADVNRQRPVILADPRGNNLLVTANQEDHRSLDELLKKLDVKLENPSLTLTVMPLKHNDSARVAVLLESLFAARLRAQTLPGQNPLPSEQIKVEPDPLNNALIISASKENVELIQGLVSKIDAEPAIPGGVLEMFTLQFADAQRVSTVLRSLVEQGLYRPGMAAGTAGRGTSRDALALSVDARSNTLIVSASPENLTIVREIVRKLDTRDSAATGDVKLYVLKNARASTLATTLTQFFQAKRAADTVAVNAGERLVPVAVIGDDRVNTLLVIGGKEAFDTADRVIQQLDGDSVFSRLNFRVFPLKKATALKLQATLQPIFANRPPRVRGEPLDPITIVADAWVNALLVGANVEDLSTVEALIQRLDTEQTDPGLAVHLFPLAKADARKVAATVQSIYREGLPGSVLPIAVSADERINAIVVSAGENDVKRIGELVSKLDTDQVARVSEIRVFPLRHARAENLSSILTTALNTKPAPLTEQSPNAQSVLQFITRTEKGQELVSSALKESVLITPDPRVNSLIVSAPVDYMGLLDQIITRLDDASHRKAKIKVFSLTNADARQTSELLSSMFRLQPTAAGTASGARSIQYSLLKPHVGELDPNKSPGNDEEIASAVLGSEEQSALTMSIDPRTNTLLVGGTEDYVALVTQIIETLDSSPAMERKTEVYRLRNAQAQEVALAVRTFLDQEKQRVTQVLGADAVGTSQRLLEREIAVVAEQTSNALLISASPRYFDQVKSLIEELDQAQSQVLVQVLIAEVSLDSGLDLGLEWNYNGVPYAAGIEVNEASWISGGFSSAVTGGDYSFLFRTLEDKGRLEVLSRPQIVTADNKPAVIKVGQTIPLITDSRVTERGDTINSFRYENVGINLRVTPRIAPDGFVKLEVGTTNSTVSSSTVRINNEAEVPIVNERVASTTVTVQSGQSILIGGLIGTLDDKRIRKVPFLGDIPGLGTFFRSARNRKERKELLILLTPQVLNKSEVEALRMDPRVMTDDQLRNSRIKDEIQRDEVQNQILDPVFPREELIGPPAPEAPKKKRSKGGVL